MPISTADTPGHVQTNDSCASLAGHIFTLREKYAPGAPPPLLAVAGTFNAGKSTLINSLLESSLSPVDILPSTPCPLLFQFGGDFHALAVEGLRRRQFSGPRELSSYLQRLHRRGDPQQVTITLPHPWLKLCRLLDTPGIDTDRGENASPYRADLLVYLFHQRGIGADDYRFLQQLKVKRGRRHTSFWINCNHGRPDGTALLDTRSTLAEIFGREMPLYYLNTKTHRSVARLKDFLTVELAALILEELRNTWKQLDQSIPRRLKNLCRLPTDAELLLQFWTLKEDAENILAAVRLVESLAAARRRIAQTMDEDRPPVVPVNPAAPRMKVEGKTVDLAAVKEKLRDFVRRLLAEPSLGEKKKELTGLMNTVLRDNLLVTAYGPFSSGKSTFFNALMGEELLPAQDKPTTACTARLHYGREKTAVLSYARQIMLPLINPVEGGYELCRRELNVLYKWLSDPGFTADLLGAEALFDGKTVSCDAARLRRLLEETARVFASPYLSPDRRGAVPALVRRLSGKRTASAVRNVRLILRPPQKKIYRLDDPAEKEQFRRLVSSDEAFCLENVDIFYPAELFKATVFIDTPGFDPAHGPAGGPVFPKESDIILLFLHGRHILAEKLRPELLPTPAGESGRSMPPEEAVRWFFLINFADTLNRAEKERVVNYVRRHLAAAGYGACPAPGTGVHLISCLAALEGNDDGSFQRFLKQLERAVITLRGGAILGARLARLEQMLEQSETAEPEQNRRRRQYRRELREIQRLLDAAGGYCRWKTPVCSKKD